MLRDCQPDSINSDSRLTNHSAGDEWVGAQFELADQIAEGDSAVAGITSLEPSVSAAATLRLIMSLFRCAWIIASKPTKKGKRRASAIILARKKPSTRPTQKAYFETSDSLPCRQLELFSTPADVLDEFREQLQESPEGGMKLLLKLFKDLSDLDYNEMSARDASEWTMREETKRSLQLLWGRDAPPGCSRRCYLRHFIERVARVFAAGAIIPTLVLRAPARRRPTRRGHRPQAIRQNGFTSPGPIPGRKRLLSNECHPVCWQFHIWVRGGAKNAKVLLQKSLQIFVRM